MEGRGEEQGIEDSQWVFHGLGTRVCAQVVAKYSCPLLGSKSCIGARRRKLRESEGEIFNHGVGIVHKPGNLWVTTRARAVCKNGLFAYLIRNGFHSERR